MAQPLPIDAATKDWIDARASWLLDQFSREFVRSCALVLPTSEFFPQDFRPSEENAREVLDQLCGYMNIDRATIDLEFYDESDRADGGATTVGLYEQVGDRFRIWIEAKQLHDPPSLAATIAHELGHVHLLGHGRVAHDTVDHEPLTDLLTVFLGLGIITANAALRDVNQRAGTWEVWRIDQRGYLTMPMFGYALALFSQIRDEFRPAWPKYVRPDVRHALRQSLLYLDTHGLPELRTVKTTTSLPTLALFAKVPIEVTPVFDAPGTIEANISLPACSFCEAILNECDDDGICEECQLSIEENLKEIDEERRDQESTARNKQLALRIGCGTIVASIAILSLLDWFGVFN